ncbi:putative response regulator receiver (CheY-like protein) [Rhodovulum sp. PH10]|uniref:response regulator n=1 Tax=Rhodovulum sp. PH10 TaxID=1187851 RepID=UPI00027C26BE|nr:response regulator [Rhodovulum sp. PH10]EJW10771.1 putative response regulator receiver (CheY-like protein) [Rhodovulum sp. PH10]
MSASPKLQPSPVLFSETPPKSAPRKSLLVIDDDPTHRTIVCRVADRAGFAAIGAATVEDAELLLGSHRFDCITLDIGLGSRTGFDVLEAMAEVGSDVPIVIVSGREPAERREAAALARGLGLNVCTPLTKPIDPIALRGRLGLIHHRISIGLCGCCGSDCELRAPTELRLVV